MKFLVGKVGDLDIAFNIEMVEGALEDVNLVPIPKAPDYLSGIANVRNQIIPAISIAKLLNQELKEGKKWIIYGTQGVKYLCELDEIGEIIECAEITPMRKKEEILVGTIEKAGSIYTVIDPHRITRR
ncbi:MAG TPA: hypothetical protein EYP24_03205 [bacterium (Candidatus Stahlbacteria)]|nr:hypothetical protein [Candidatus Stahlbacteria bacterium]